jgi:hypothetical protein
MQFSDQAGSDVFSPNSPHYNSQLQAVRQEGVYRLKCDLPNPDNTWSRQVRCLPLLLSVVFINTKLVCFAPLCVPPQVRPA